MHNAKITLQTAQYKQSGEYAVVYIDGKRIYLGVYGTEESKIAYAHVLTEQANPNFSPPKGEDITVRKLTAASLEHAKATLKPTNYAHYRVVVLDFLNKFYGDNTPVNDFSSMFEG